MILHLPPYIIVVLNGCHVHAISEGVFGSSLGATYSGKSSVYKVGAAAVFLEPPAAASLSYLGYRLSRSNRIDRSSDQYNFLIGRLHRQSPSPRGFALETTSHDGVVIS